MVNTRIQAVTDGIRQRAALATRCRGTAGTDVGRDDNSGAGLGVQQRRGMVVGQRPVGSSARVPWLEAEVAVEGIGHGVLPLSVRVLCVWRRKQGNEGEGVGGVGG